jgi:hypothetical protein
MLGTYPGSPKRALILRGLTPQFLVLAVFVVWTLAAVVPAPADVRSVVGRSGVPAVALVLTGAQTASEAPLFMHPVQRWVSPHSPSFRRVSLSVNPKIIMRS